MKEFLLAVLGLAIIVAIYAKIRDFFSKAKISGLVKDDAALKTKEDKLKQEIEALKVPVKPTGDVEEFWRKQNNEKQ